MVLSLSRTGQCWDNALAESFFASLEGELTDTQPWPTWAAARRAVVEYTGWYNGTRLHSTLGYLSPGRIRDLNRKGEPQASSLTSHQLCPSRHLLTVVQSGGEVQCKWRILATVGHMNFASAASPVTL